MGEVESGAAWEVITPTSKVIPTADKSRRVDAMGTIEAGDLHIFLQERLLTEIVDYSRTSMEREVGGVLPGTVYEHRGVPYIELDGYIRAPGDSRAASFRFTADAWSSIREKQGDQILVGWHHTHPGYGIFLSGTDMFSHKSFFNLPWMFALVVDPKAETLGFFQWKNKNVAKCGFFFVR